jgi:hypothetical protein
VISKSRILPQIGFLSVVLVAACEPDGCGGIETGSIGNLQFLDKATNNLLDGELVGAGRTFAFGEGELPVTLTTTDLNTVRVVYLSESPTNTEAVMFAWDPAAHYATLRQDVTNRDIGSWTRDTTLTLDLDCWYFPGCAGDYMGPAAWPNAIAVPQPNLNCLGPTCATAVELHKQQFWLNDVPFGPAASPAPAGAIKAARVYDHGRCSRAQPLKDQLWDQSFDGWDQFVDEIGSVAVVDAVQRYWMNAATWLDHGEGDSNDIRGGFLVDMSLNVETAFYTNDVNVDAAASYTFGLSDAGVLEVSKEVLVLDVDGVDYVLGGPEGLSLGTLIGNAVGDTEDRVSDQLEKIREKINERARKEQVRDIFNSNTACQPATVETDCNLQQGALLAAIAVGAATMNASGEESFDLVSANSDGVRMIEAAANQWVCEPELKIDPSCPPAIPCMVHTCKFIMPAKRLNVHPDEVEIVWFDGKEVDNPAYAVWVAAHANADVEMLVDSQLCQWTPPTAIETTTGEFRRRQFVSVFLGPEYVDF